MTLLQRIKAAVKFVLNRYDGAQYSPNRPYVYEEVQSARWDVDQPTRRELVRLSRNAEKNVAIVNKLVDVFEQYVVGRGLVVQPNSGDEEWNKVANEWWQGWAEIPDATSRQEFGTLLGLVARSWFIDGEAFILLTKGESGRPRIQVIESHLVATPPQKSTDSNIVDGIQLDPRGRPEGYWIITEDAQRRQVYTLHPADSVIHVFEPGRAGQYRGLPFLYPVLNTLRDLDLLKTLEMQAAKAAAQVTTVIKTNGGEISPELLRRSLATGTRTTAGGTSVSTSYSRFFKDVTGAEPIQLKVGEEFAQFKSERPSVASRDYWRMLEQDVCVGVGIPHVLIFPESMQGTVYRGALDMAAAYFKIRSAVLTSAVRRIYGYVMGWARYAEPSLRDAPSDWRRIKVICPKAVNVDVGRNSNAMLQELAAGTRTFAGIAGDDGEDYRVTLRQKAAEARYIRDLAEEFEIDPSEISNVQIDRPERVQSEVTSNSNVPEPEPVEGDEVKEATQDE